MKIYTLNSNVYKVEFKDFFFSIDVDLRYSLGYISRNAPCNLKLDKKFVSKARCVEFMFKKSLIVKELVDESDFDEVEIINGNYEQFNEVFDKNERIDYYFNFNDGRKLFDKYLDFIVTRDYVRFTNGEISAKQLIKNFMIEKDDLNEKYRKENH